MWVIPGMMRNNLFRALPENRGTMKVIGITGGVGSGKTAVLNAIKETYNCIVLFADEVANILKLPGQACYEQVVELLGEEILDENGYIDNKKMAQVIFKDASILQKINDIIHPLVYNEIVQTIETERTIGKIDYLFVEAALFIEAGYKAFSDYLWYIYVPKDVRSLRLKVSRGYSDEKISDIMNRQLQEEAFLQACDVVIDNSGSLEETMKQVEETLQKYEIM